MKIKILEVGPRDGLQNESKKVPVAARHELIRRLAKSGHKYIEIGAFVSPRWVPQMAESNKLVQKSLADQKSGKISKSVHLSVLVPNIRGMQDAIPTGIKEIAVFGACSESFSKRNINCSINESFNRFSEVLNVAKKNKIKVRGYLSMAFGCPYEGKVSQAKVSRLIGKMLDLGVNEVSLGDTIGVATPKQVRELLKKLKGEHDFKKIAMHFHDTRGSALANVLASLDHGIQVFDASVGGLGGCPYGDGASGNLATEDLVYMLHGMGLKTGIDISELIKTNKWISQKMGRTLPSKVGEAGLPMPPVF